MSQADPHQHDAKKKYGHSLKKHQREFIDKHLEYERKLRQDEGNRRYRWAVGIAAMILAMT